MVRVKGDITISRSVEDVFDFVADERNRYDPRIRRAEKLTDGPIGVGTRFRSESTSMGRTLEMEIEITEHDRPRRLGFLVRHRLLYVLSLAGAGGALVVFAARARRSRETWKRLGWGALAAGQGLQILGIWWARRWAAVRRG